MEVVEGVLIALILIINEYRISLLWNYRSDLFD